MNEESRHPHYQSTFKEIVVVLNDGNEVIMSKCLNCNFVTRYLSFSKLNHWKRCASQWQFKFIKQNEESGFVAICLQCHEKIYSNACLDQELRYHHQKCPAPNGSYAQHQMAQNNNNLPEEFDTYLRSDGIEYVHENSVSSREIEGQIKSYRAYNTVTSSPGYKIKYCVSAKGLEPLAECQICKKSFKKPFYSLATHRKSCQIPGEVLFTVTTQPMVVSQFVASPTITSQPFDMTISSSVLDDEGGAQSSVNTSNIHRICFICNTTACEQFVNLYDTVTEHSQTQIFDYVWKFLDNQPSIRDDSIDAVNSKWNSVCAWCLDRINKYDLAYVTAANLEKELSVDLAHTEAFYAEQQNTQGQVTHAMEDVAENPLNERNNFFDPLEIENQENIVVSVDCPLGLIEEEREVERPDLEKEQNDDANYIIELSDDEDAQAIVLSDDE